MVRVRVLGAVEIAMGSRRIGMNTEGLFALALYLSTRAGERIPREELLTLLWTKGSDAQQRHALRQMLYRLRQKGCTLDEEGDWVRLDAGRVDSDLRTALSAEWIDQATAAQVDAAARFMPIFSRKIAPNFVAWLDEIRELLSSQHRKAAHRQILVARREGRWADLERWAQAVLRTDPLNEEATLARAESAAMAGSKTIAMEILDTYLMEVGDISDDLGKPALALRKRLAERRPDWSFRGPKEVALIGRTELMSRLTGLVEAAWKGDGSAVVLVGAPGIGKTRLAMETRAYAELKGMRTVVVRAEAGMIERPLSLIQLLVAKLIELPGAVACSPQSYDLLKRTVDQSESPWVHGVTDPEGQSRALLAHALQELGRAISAETRLLVIIDDVHGVDRISAELLRRHIRSVVKTRICWILVARVEGNSRHSDSAIEGLAHRIRVPALDLESSVTLAIATSEAHRLELSPDALASLVQSAAGNPLFVRELSLARSQQPAASRLPESLAHLISERLERVPADQLRLLRTVALLGDAANIGRLLTITGLSPSSLSDSTESLEHDGILGLGSVGELRIHECWRDAIVDSLTPAARAALSHECANVLASSPEADHAPQLLWRAADLYAIAGEARRALDLYVLASERLLGLGFATEAVEILQRTSVMTAHPSDRLRVASRLVRAHLSAGETERALTISERAVRDAAPVPPEGIEDFMHCQCARAEATLNLARPWESVLDSLLQLSHDPRLAAAHKRTVCLYGIRLAASVSADEMTQAFYSRSQALEDEAAPSATAWLTSTVFLTELGSVDEILQQQEMLARVDLSPLSAFDRCRILRFRCHSLRIAGDGANAVLAGIEAHEFALANRLFHDARLTAELLSFLFLDQGDLENASLWISRSSETTPDSEYSATSPSLLHAQDRLLLQRGEFAEAASHLTARLAAIRKDGTVRNRSGELSTLALCLAETGQEELADVLLREFLPELPSILGSFGADYPVEIAGRALAKIGKFEESLELATTHIRKKITRRERPLPSFYGVLRSARDKLASGDSDELPRVT